MPKNKRPTAEPPALFDLEPELPKQETPAPSSYRDGDHLVEQVMYSLTAPFIGYPGWGDDPQFWEPHKTRVTMERLLHHQETHRDKVATEYETMLYLSSASLAAPMSHHWAQLYFYLFTRCMGEQAKEIGNEVKVLDSGQREDLARLRRWVFRVQMNHIKAKLRDGNRPKLDKERKQLEVERPRMF